MATVFAVAAALCAAGTAPLAANATISRGLIVLPLILVGILLFVSGYYTGLSRTEE